MKSLYKFLSILILITLISCGGKNDDLKGIKLIPVKSDKEFQYIDTDGKVIINPQFETATFFRDGLALVKPIGEESKYGFINEKGKYTIEPKYKEATVFSEGLAWVVEENGAPSVIDTKGKLKFTLKEASAVSLFSEGLASYSVFNDNGDELVGFVDNKGNVVIEPQFVFATFFKNGKCGVMNEDGKWGFIDSKGNLSINYQFDNVSNFIDNRSSFETNEKYGIIDNKGKYLVNPQFSNLVIDGKLSLIKQNNKWGWIDENGNLVINPQFDEALPFNGNDLTPVKSGKKYGYIDKDGKIAINSQFEFALPFFSKKQIAPVVNSDGKIGFINKDGKYVINPQFKDFSEDFTYFNNTYYNEYLWNLDLDIDFMSVTTDYFDINSMDFIEFENPLGISLDSDFSMIKDKFPDKEIAVWRYSNTLEEGNINNDINYSIQLLGRHEIGEEKFTSIDGVGYNINLEGKAAEKSHIIFDYLQEQLIKKGFTVDESKENNSRIMNFKKNRIRVSIESSRYNLLIRLQYI